MKSVSLIAAAFLGVISLAHLLRLLLCRNGLPAPTAEACIGLGRA